MRADSGVSCEAVVSDLDPCVLTAKSMTVAGGERHGYRLQFSAFYGLLCRFLVFSVLAKVSIDYFMFSVSPNFGSYGVDLNGTFFSAEYWISWFVFVFSAIPLILYSASERNPFDAAVVLVYFATLLPTASLYWIRGAGLEYLLYCVAFWTGLAILLVAMPKWGQKPAEVPPLSLPRDTLAWVFAFILFWMFLFFLSLVPGALEYGLGFDTVYERRKIFGVALGGGVLVYLVSWSAYVLVVYLIFAGRNIYFRFFALFYIVLLFFVSGDKIYLFFLLMVAFIGVVSRSGRVWLIPAGIGLASFLGSVLYRVGDVWVASIVHRLIVMNADIAFKSAEFFQDSPQYYSYSFMSPFIPYNYSDIPSRLIGSAFFVGGDNATAGFLADAYVNLGLLGLFPLLAFFVGLRLLLINSGGLLLIVPLFVQIIDTPLPTACNRSHPLKKRRQRHAFAA